jgi:arsenical pump membrane protein
LATTLLANDGAILLITPIVAELTTALGFSPGVALAYLFSTGFLCDALSTVLPTSNLTNILLIDTLHARAGTFIVSMLLPSLAMLLVGMGTLAVEFRRSLPSLFANAALAVPPAFPARSARATGIALVILIAGYAVAALLRLPLGAVVLLVALLLAAVEARAGAVHARGIARQLPLSIVVFATALFIIVTAVNKAGADRYVAAALFPAGQGRFIRLLCAGVAVSLLSSLCNNLPVFLASLLALAQMGPHAGQVAMLPYAALLGANVGSKLTPIGSLATLLWLGVLRRHGLRIGWPLYVKLAFVPTVLTFLTGLLLLTLF